MTYTINGKDFLLYINGSPLCYEKELDINIKLDIEDMGGEHKVYKVNKIEYGITSSGIVFIGSDKTGFFDLQLAQINSTPLLWKAMDKSGTGRVISGNVIISSSKLNAADGYVSYDITMIGTGAINNLNIRQIVYGIIPQTVYGKQQDIVIGELIEEYL